MGLLKSDRFTGHWQFKGLIAIIPVIRPLNSFAILEIGKIVVSDGICCVVIQICFHDVGFIGFYMSKYPSELPSLKFFLTELPIFRDELLEMANLRHKKKPFPKKWLSMFFFNPEVRSTQH
jgi:hypothetical protein